MCCCRRRPRLGPDGWFGGVGGPGDMQQQEPGFLHSLSDFLDTMGSGMAALGLFAQVCVLTTLCRNGWNLAAMHVAVEDCGMLY